MKDGDPITTSGKPVALSSGVIRVSDQREPIPTFPQAHDPGFRSFSAAGFTVYHVESPVPGVIKPRLEDQGQTLTDNGPAIRIIGPDIRLASGVVLVHIASISVSLPRPPTQGPSPVVVDGMTFSPLPKTAVASRIPPLIVARQSARREKR